MHKDGALIGSVRLCADVSKLHILVLHHCIKRRASSFFGFYVFWVFGGRGLLVS